LPLSLCAAVPHRAAVIALICVIGVGNALADIGLYTLPARLVPDRLLARMFGAKESLTALTLGIGSLVAPLAIDVLGVRGALAALGLVAPACVLFSWPRLRAIDASIEHRDNEIDVLKQVRMFGPLPMPAIDELALHVDRVDYSVGEHVFCEGDDGDHLYVINTGEADV